MFGQHSRVHGMILGVSRAEQERDSMTLRGVLHLNVFCDSMKPSQQIKRSTECFTLISLVRLFLLYYFLDTLLVIFDEQVHHINTEIIDQD